MHSISKVFKELHLQEAKIEDNMCDPSLEERKQAEEGEKTEDIHTPAKREKQRALQFEGNYDFNEAETENQEIDQELTRWSIEEELEGELEMGEELKNSEEYACPTATW